MAYVPIPKDLTKVKSRFLFGLTKRQVVCFGICGPLEVIEGERFFVLLILSD